MGGTQAHGNSGSADDDGRGRRDYRAPETRRSRSRGDRGDEDHRWKRDSRRSRSREAPRSRGYDGGYQQRESTRGGPPMESRTIQITGGAVATRLWLKKEM